MDREAYELTALHEASHWWFCSRRDLVLAQVRCAVEALNDSKEKLSLLDYGCGTGFNLQFFAEYAEPTGAEIEVEQYRDAHAALPYPVLNLADSNDEAVGAFDIVTMLDVLEHLDDDVAGLEEVKRFLKPAGQVIITVPAYRWLWSGEDVVSQHVRRYVARDLGSVAERAGYKLCYISYFNMTVLPLIAAVVWGKRLFLPRKAAHSDLKREPAWLNSLLYNITAFELRCVGREQCRLPAGASLVCRLKRDD